VHDPKSQMMHDTVILIQAFPR